MSSAAPTHVATPFPGLRSYRIAEADWFFGREGKSDAMAKKLAGGRFLAVVGESGCGKSSLVRAGLLSTLEAGLLAEAGSQWKIVDMHPAGDPIGRLSDALVKGGYTEGSSREALESDPGALAKVYAAYQGFRGSLLLLVDQFEELFRYSAHRDEKAGFVQLLLQAAHQANAPIYVVLTMRSDFLGECAQFRGLPEEINEGQYLVPRMTRDNMREAIEGPIRLAGAEIEPRLTQILLDEVGSEPDQLPVLQHALKRTWNNWVKRGDLDDLVREKPDYSKTGRLQNALSKDADEALRDAAAALGGAQNAESLAAVVFPLLWDRDANGRDVRRPETQGMMTRVSGASSSDIGALLKEFREPVRTFLSVSREVEPGEDGEDIEYDVTHESFLRKWKRLREEWIPAEIASRRIYLRLVERVQDSSYLDGAVLDQTLDWAHPAKGSGKRKPTAAWAERYATAFPLQPADRLFDNAMTFLARSAEERQARIDFEHNAVQATKRKRRAYWIIAASLLLTVIVGLLAVEFWRQEKHVRVLDMTSRALLASLNPEQLERSLLLAAESERIEPTVEAQALISRGLDLLPKPLPDLAQPQARFVVYNLDGTRLATADRAGHITIWNTQTNAKVSSLQGPPKLRGVWWLQQGILVLARDAAPQILGLDGKSTELKDCKADALAVSPDATQVIAHCSGYQIVVWSVDSETFKVALRVKTPSYELTSRLDVAVSNPKISPTGRGTPWTAFVTQDVFGASVQLYSAKLKKFLGPSKTDTRLAALQFDGETLTAVGADGRVYRWELSPLTGQLAQSTNPLDAKTFDFSNARANISSDYVIAGALTKAVAVWDPNGRQSAVASASAPVTAVAASQHEFCALGRDGAVRRWHMPDLKIAAHYSGTFSSDARWLMERNLQRWSLLDTASGAVQSSGSIRPFSPRTFGPSGDSVVGYTVGGGYEVRAFKDGHILPDGLGDLPIQLPKGAITLKPQFSPDGKTLLTAYSMRRFDPDSTQTTTAWDWKSGHALATQQLASLAFMFYGPDSDTVFVDTGEKLSAWHVRRNAVEPVPVKFDGVHTAWATVPEKGLAACGVIARAAQAIDPEEEEDSDTPPNEASTGSQVIVWSYPDWKEQVRLDHPDKVRLISFSQDGSRLLTVTFDGTVRLWDWKEKKQLAMVSIGSNAVAVAITSDGEIAVQGRYKFAVYDWQPEKLREEVCRSVRQNLSTADWKDFQLEASDFPKEKLCSGLP